MAFPPVPVFPNGIDSDYTLYLVHNTSETRLCADNAAWSAELSILPVTADKAEIWADNGFATIEGELFYYDSVEYDDNGKVNKLKGCARNLTGKTKFNSRGTWVRGFVVAEHHNQLVDTIVKIEDFIGYNGDPRRKTLDWRIRNLQELSVIFDDHNCPDVNFTWNIIENSIETGILARYDVAITPPGTINTFRLDFGDGQFTTTEFNGEHRYSLNAIIDPVITVSNDKCQIIQTPYERENPSEPPQVIVEEFTYVVPETVTVPDFNFVPCEVPEPEFVVPVLGTPCISLDSGSGVIIGPDISMVSNVIIEGPTYPVQVLHSVVTIEGGFSLPSHIFIDAPPTIVIDPPIPPTIVIVSPSTVSMGMDYGAVPMVQVDWGTPPEMEIQMTFAREVKTPTMFAQDAGLKNEFGEEFADLFEADNHIKIEYETAGIPSEIRIIAPDLPDFKIDASDLPKTIKIETTDVHIPDSIRIFGPETPIPDIIQIRGPETPLPEEIRFVKGDDIPTEIPLVFPKEPLTVVLEHKFTIEMPKPFPDKIFVDASGIPSTIQVVGMPETLQVLGIPDFIPVRFPTPEEMPKMEIVYNGGPIKMQLEMSEMVAVSEDGKTQCVTIMPCPR